MNEFDIIRKPFNMLKIVPVTDVSTAFYSRNMVSGTT